MLTIKNWEKKWNLAKTFWQILKWRKEDTESSTLPCHPLTFLCSTINWIMYPKSWNVLQKLTLHLDSFWKILRMECADTFMLTRTIRLWRSRNLCVHQTILPTWKRNYRKWILLIFVHEREPIQNGSFTNWQMWQLLQRYSKDIPMGCKYTVLLEPLLKNHNVNCLTFDRNTSQPYNDNLCLFRALALQLHGNEKLGEETSKFFNLFLNNSEEGDVSKFQGIHLNDIPKVEDLLQLNIFLYDIDFVDGELIGELARRSIPKYEKSVKLLCYNHHICYVNNVNALFKAFLCAMCDTFFSKTGNLERHLVTCSDRVKHIHPKNVYELRETLFEKLDAFNIPYKKEQKLFKNLTIWLWVQLCQGRLL